MNFKHLNILFILSFTAFAFLKCTNSSTAPTVSEIDESEQVWYAPDTNDIPDDAFGDMVRYGRKLVVNTAYYLGPEGTVGQYLGNKMNCVNCHLDAGTRPYGLNYLSTHGRYPQYRARENMILTCADRINNCVERPHNGIPLPLDSKELNAIQCYIKWLGTNVPVEQRVEGDNGVDIKLPDFALSPAKGKVIYENSCARCHGTNGEGKLLASKITYEYPPLWGKDSYQPGSSMYRVIKAAKFIKANMPNDKSNYEHPYLSDIDALQVAAYVNSAEHERPAKTGSDYPDIKMKAIDYPFGPYNDPFTEEQHKYGPYQPIIDYRTKKGLYVNY
jgi:thiosulfate dehydrogenase